MKNQNRNVVRTMAILGTVLGLAIVSGPSMLAYNSAPDVYSPNSNTLGKN
jgi:hypothetical protein